MAILINQSKTAREVRYFSIDESRVKWKSLKQRAEKAFIFFVIAYFVSPIGAIAALFLFVLQIAQIWHLFFRNVAYQRQYMALFQPQTAEKVASIIGYRVYQNEVDGHLAIIKSGNQKSLGDLQEKMERIVSNRPRWVGIDQKTAKTHIALIGTTGAGKTECVRSFMNDIMRFGGGILFNDGKSDVKMITEILEQAKWNNRETSVRVLNFLKAEKLAESNTYNFLSTLHPLKLSGFLANLNFKSDSGGDGNHAHFQKRGKTLMNIVTYTLWLRKQIAGENFNPATLQKTMNFLPLCLQYIAFYCMCRDINELLRQNDEISHLLNTDKGLVINHTPYFNQIERVRTHIISNPENKKIIDTELGFDSKLAIDCYAQVFEQLEAYLSEVWLVATPMLRALSIEIYYTLKKAEEAKKEQNPKYIKKTFFDRELKRANVFTLADIQTAFNDIKENPSRNLSYTRKDYAKEMADGDYAPPQGIETIKKQIEAAFAEKTEKASLEKPTNDAVQQHAYAQQQWTNLFSTLSPYEHIFSQIQSEIDLVTLFRDNQILYILLPVLELSKDEVETLGKIIISSIKDYASSALGGESISAHKTIMNIQKDKITPKPFTLIVLDEYGSYAVNDIDTILAQVRSINMAVMLGIQDIVSLKAGGTNETSKQRALANTTKIFFKLKDEEAVKWAEQMISDEVVEEGETKIDAMGDLVASTSVNIKNEKIVNIKKVQEADNGFCLLMMGGQNDRAIWIQTFFRGGKVGATMLKHFAPIQGLSNESYLKYAA